MKEIIDCKIFLQANKYTRDIGLVIKQQEQKIHFLNIVTVCVCDLIMIEFVFVFSQHEKIKDIQTIKLLTQFSKTQDKKSIFENKLEFYIFSIEIVRKNKTFGFFTFQQQQQQKQYNRIISEMKT